MTPEHICRLAVDLAAAELDKREAKVAFRFGTDGQRFPLDPDLLCQAFLNVIRNAAEAMAPGGTLAIETSTREEGGQVWLRFAFADEGPGVPEEIRDRIFHPFFTTRAKGTGLGLAITHKILQDHGGTVAVEENQPRGAIFVFRVPVGVA